MKKGVKGSILLLIATVVWGASFVAQSIGGNILGPFTFAAIRLLIGAVFLHFVMKFTDKIGISSIPPEKTDKKRQFIIGIICGALIAIAINCQQFALYLGVPGGKAGFLASLYILIVPILGFFIGKRSGLNVWIGIGIAVIGLYFLCVSGGFGFQLGDILLFVNSLAFAFQIIIIDKFGKQVDSFRLSGMEFLFAGVLTLIVALFTEIIPYPGGFAEWIKLFANGQLWIVLIYMGIGSSGIAYTLQVLGQKDTDPTVAALIMSLEAVFAVIAGWIILGEVLSTNEFIGCALLLIAIIIAQVKMKKSNTKFR